MALTALRDQMGRISNSCGGRGQDRGRDEHEQLPAHRPRPPIRSGPQGPFGRGVEKQQGLNQQGAASGCYTHVPTHPLPQKHGLHTRHVSCVAAGLGVLNDHKGHGSVLMQLTGQWWRQTTKGLSRGREGDPSSPTWGQWLSWDIVKAEGTRGWPGPRGTAKGQCGWSMGGGKGPEPGQDWAVSSGQWEPWRGAPHAPLPQWLLETQGVHTDSEISPTQGTVSSDREEAGLG